MWLLWYLYHSRLALPENKRKLGGIPRHFVAIRRGAVPKNKSGEPVMPLGPMFAKVGEALTREMNRLGLRPKNPGVNKIAEGLRADHGSVTGWLKADQPGLNIWPDGEAGMHYSWNLDTITRNIKIVAGKKRGRKPKKS